MATLQIGSRSLPGVQRGGKGHNGGDNVAAGLANANSTSLAGKRARLTAINGAYYTSTRLDQLTENDIDYALRLADAPGSI